MPPVGDTDHCFAHDPARAADRARARKQGGHQRHAGTARTEGRGRAAAPREVVTLGSVADVRTLLERTVGDTLALDNSPQRSRTIGGLLGVALKALEVGELEARVAALEERLNSHPGPRRIA
jgi:hypothetical protein